MDDDLNRIRQLAGLSPLNEDSPPGFEGTVKAMKKHKDIDNPWALSWYMKNKGYHSHKTQSGKEKHESIVEDAEGDVDEDAESDVDETIAEDTARLLTLAGMNEQQPPMSMQDFTTSKPEAIPSTPPAPANVPQTPTDTTGPPLSVDDMTRK